MDAEHQRQSGLAKIDAVDGDGGRERWVYSTKRCEIIFLIRVAKAVA